MPLWDFQGSTMVTSQYVRLTPDERSREGSIWNRVVRAGGAGPGLGAALPPLPLTPPRFLPQPCFLKDWELHVHFKIHGAGKKNLHGDGLALWYTQERLTPGQCRGQERSTRALSSPGWCHSLRDVSRVFCPGSSALSHLLGTEQLRTL